MKMIKKNFIDKIDQSGLPHNIDITIYENAHHSFDREMELTKLENGEEMLNFSPF